MSFLVGMTLGVGGLILALAWEGWGGWCTLVVASLGDDPLSVLSESVPRVL